MTRQINKEGLEHIKRWEGLRLKAYVCPAGVLTIGYGHTSAAGAPKVTRNMVITESEAEAILRRDLGVFERAVIRLVKVALNDNQFAALVSFCYNVGESAFAKSTLLKRLNAGDYDAVPAQLARWNKAAGKVVKGLVNRRAAEAGLWAKGSFVASRDVYAKPQTEPVLTKENVSWGAGIASTASFAFAGNGPMQYALAAIVLVAFAVALFFFIRRRVAT